jgi:adenylate cyclase
VLGTTTDWLLGRQEPDGDAFDATVFVSSIQDFTTRSEKMKPEQVAMWANGFLHQATEAALREGGIPVKYLGDALLAFFAGDQHEARAASAAIAARHVVTDQLVVGLVSGSVYLTPIGHSRYARPDIMGATVNKAFRVHAWAAANAETGVAAAFPPEWQAPAEIAVRPHPAVNLKGLATPVDLRELAARPEQ